MDCHQLRILNYFQVEAHIENPPEDFPFTHVISIGGMTPPPIGLETVNNLRLCYDDIVSRNLYKVEEDGKPPKHRHIMRALQYAHGVLTPILIHCDAGVSRSSATALAIILSRLGPGREQEAIDRLLRIKRHIYPNDLLVQYTDEIIGCCGKLVKAFERTFKH